MTVLVAYASKHGSTAEIAEAIAGTLRETGLDVECREASDVKSLDRYDAVVLGSAVYLKRWRANAKRFLRKHADTLATMPFWVFSSGPVGDPAEEAEASEWLEPPRIVERVQALGARQHVVLGGRAPVGSRTEKRTPEEFRDRRDWDQIRAWAQSIAAELRASAPVAATHQRPVGHAQRRQTVPAEMPTTTQRTASKPSKRAARRGGRHRTARRLLDALRFAAALLSWLISRRAVRARGDEDRREFPGDELLPRSKGQWTNAITIRARPSDIWPWLVQMGCRRAGWYSYDGLDNGGQPSAERIVPELQDVELGDVFPWTPTDRKGFVVRAIEPDRALVLGGTPPPFRLSWAFVLQPLDEMTTRLVARCRAVPRSVAVGLLLRLFHPVHSPCNANSCSPSSAA